MKPKDQRIAIAEAVGWEKHREIEPGHWVWRHPVTKLVCGQTLIPDYLNDLNAMHAAEQTLRDQCLYWPDYIDELVTLCTNAYPHLPNEKLEPNWSATVGATAEQRAEAFLRCLGLWKD